MQITDLAVEEKITPIWRLGFRPFFLFGAIFSIFSILIWQLIYTGKLAFSPYGGGYWWHIHEMIFGFVIAIIAGFLLTAVQNWTGQRGIHGKPLLALFSLWLAGRIALLLPEYIPQILTVIIDISFLPTVAWALAKPIIQIKQYRNLFFVPLLTLFTAFNGLFHYAVIAEQALNLATISHSCLLLICFLISVMAGRVTPMFTANGTQTEKVTSLPLLEKITNGSLLLTCITLLVSAFIYISPQLLAVLFVIAGTSQLIRWLRWRPWITYQVPLLWSLHGAIKFLAYGLLLLAASYLWPELPKHHLWHFLTIGAIGGVILAMIARVSLGHTGRPLQPPLLTTIAFILLPISALLRSLGPWLWPEFTLWFIKASSGLWMLAFLLFVISYAPMLLSARADGRPG